MDTDLAQLIARTEVSRSEIARRAGVPRSTLYRALEGNSGVRLGTLRELACAAGFQLELHYTPTSSPDAADAARMLLGEGEGAQLTQGVEEWAERLQRYVGNGTVVDLLEEAGSASSLLKREAAIRMRGVFSADRLASAGYATGKDWALSGVDALEALGVEVGNDGIHVFWSEDPQHAKQLLLDTGRISKAAEDVDLIICEPSVLTFADSREFEGIRLVSPTQAIIDCMGLRDIEQALAREVMRGW